MSRNSTPVLRYVLNGTLVVASLAASMFLRGVDSPWTALWPSAIALLYVLLFRHVIVALALGALCGTVLLSSGPLDRAVAALAVDHVVPSFQSSWKVGALLFTLFLGGFTSLIERGGGLRTLVTRFVGNRGSGARRLQLGTLGLGFLCFFDGLANSILLGRLTRSMARPCGVSRVKLAYIVDSTSSAVACIAFISTWIATQLSLINDGLAAAGHADAFSAYRVFFASIPLNFYCLFTLGLLFLVIVLRADIGPMRAFEARARAGGSAATERGDDAAKADGASGTGKDGGAWTALLPIGALIAGIMLTFYLWEARPLLPVTAAKLADAFSSGDGPWILLTGSVIGIAIACLTWPHGKRDSRIDAFLDGAGAMIPPLVILVAAWALGSVISALGAAETLAAWLDGRLHPALFPAAVFATGALISFSTGTSWGTMALLMPLAIPPVFALAGGDGAQDVELLLSATVAAVFSGAVFGDHCSPFSDTTIVSSIATGVEPIDHVKTQLPYALIAAAAAIVFGFLPVGAFPDISPAIPLAAGAAALTAVAWLFRARGPAG